MTDYWKSQDRKFCDFCKCWIADNKPSVQFHENGKRHKENVSKRLKEIHKNSAKQFKQQKKFDSDIQAMEKAAMAAYLKDVENNSLDITSKQILENKNSIQRKEIEPTYNPNQMPQASADAHPRGKLSKPKYTAADVDPFDPFAQQKLAKIAARDQKAKKKEAAKSESQSDDKKKGEKGKGKGKHKAEAPVAPVRKVWCEAKSQGYSYYWNIETNETMWDPPVEGYMSLEEQAEEAKEQELQQNFLEELEKQELIEKKDVFEEQRANAEREKLKEVRKKFYEKKKMEKSECSEDEKEKSEEEKIPYRRDYSVPEKPQPYGSWQVVRTIEKKINLQLPKVEKAEAPAITFEEPPPVRREFKEKTVTRVDRDSDDEGSSISFKKRRIGNKNVRKKIEDN